MAMIMHINSISFLKKVILKCGVISCLILTGCVATIPHAGEIELNEELGSRIQGNFFLYESENEVMESTIDSLLADGVTHHEAVQIALLNNPSIKAMYAHLRVASADVLKAVVPENPSLHASVLQGNGSGGPKTVVSLEQNLLDILLIPMKKQFADIEFERVRSELGHEILSQIAEGRKTYYRLQGEQEKLLLLEKIVDAVSAEAEMANRQFEAGNVNSLDLSSHMAVSYETELLQKESQNEVSKLKEQLRRLLGFPGTKENFDIDKGLPQIPDSEPELEELSELALTNRLDLKAAHKQLAALKQSLPLARWESFTSVDMGVEKEEELLGPTVKIGVPLFNRGGISTAQLKARIKEEEFRIEALEQDIVTEIRIIYSELMNLREKIKFYEDIIIPSKNKVVEASQKQYNFMLIGVYSLLQVKKEEIQANREYIDLIAQYWIKKVSLEKAAGQFNLISAL